MKGQNASGRRSVNAEEGLGFAEESCGQRKRPRFGVDNAVVPENWWPPLPERTAVASPLSFPSSRFAGVHEQERSTSYEVVRHEVPVWKTEIWQAGALVGDGRSCAPPLADLRLEGTAFYARLQEEEVPGRNDRLFQERTDLLTSYSVDRWDLSDPRPTRLATESSHVTVRDGGWESARVVYTGAPVAQQECRQYTSSGPITIPRDYVEDANSDESWPGPNSVGITFEYGL